MQPCYSTISSLNCERAIKACSLDYFSTISQNVLASAGEIGGRSRYRCWIKRDKSCVVVFFSLLAEIFSSLERSQ